MNEIFIMKIKKRAFLWLTSCGLAKKTKSNFFPARKAEIIKLTETIIESLNNGDLEAYT